MTQHTDTTGYVAYVCEPGELPTVLAYEATADAAQAAAAEEIARGGLEIDPDEVAVVHVELVDDRYAHPDDQWVLFGAEFTPLGYDAAVTAPTVRSTATGLPLRERVAEIEQALRESESDPGAAEVMRAAVARITGADITDGEPSDYFLGYLASRVARYATALREAHAHRHEPAAQQRLALDRGELASALGRAEVRTQVRLDIAAMLRVG